MFDQLVFMAGPHLGGQAIASSLLRRDKDRLLTIVLVQDVQGKRPDQMFYCTCWIGSRGDSCRPTLAVGPLKVTLEHCKQFLGLEDPANRLPKAVQRTVPYGVSPVQFGGGLVPPIGSSIAALSVPAVVTKKEEPSFADMLSTLRRVVGGEIATTASHAV